MLTKRVKKGYNPFEMEGWCLAEKRNEVNSLKCTLMHKRIAVAEMELDDATGLIQKIGVVYVPEHLPVGIAVKNGAADRAALNEWWTDRSIPASRSAIREALETLRML